ncbi:GNAT family N-acetyltransferase [Jatrophihabitans sp. YIM 134969]
MAISDPVTLVGALVRLDPLTPDDVDDLSAAAADGELWNLGYTSVPRPEEMAATVAARLDRQREGALVPWVARRVDTGAVIGMTNFWAVDEANRRVEIGGTWNAASAQRSGTNTESKLLLLTHAFDTLDCIAVEFRTHVLNRRSRAAIERLGARLDGILRHHQVSPDGTLRDTVVYSITAPDWPAIRNELTRRLASG